MERNTTNTHPLTKALEALGWSQGKLAEASGVAQSTISFALSGKRGGKFSAESAKKIIDAIFRETRRQKLASLRAQAERAGKPVRVNVPAKLTPARGLRLEHLIFPHAAA